MALDTLGLAPYVCPLGLAKKMSTVTLRPPTTQRDSIAPQPSSRKSTLVLIAFGLVYVVWGSTSLALPVGIESFPPLLLACARHLLTGLILYPVLRWQTGVRPPAAPWRLSCAPGFLILFIG